MGAHAAPTPRGPQPLSHPALTMQGPGGPDGESAVERFTTDMTAAARRGKLDPLIGRDDEIRRLVHILSRRTKNNPVLVGESGERVG